METISNTEFLLHINAVADSIAEFVVDDSTSEEDRIGALIRSYRIIGVCQRALVALGEQPTVDPEIWQPFAEDEWSDEPGSPLMEAIGDAHMRSLLRVMAAKGIVEEVKPDVFRAIRRDVTATGPSK